MPNFYDIFNSVYTISEPTSRISNVTTSFSSDDLIGDGIMSQVENYAASYSITDTYSSRQNTIQELRTKIKELERENKVLKDIIIEHEL